MEQNQFSPIVKPQITATIARMILEQIANCGADITEDSLVLTKINAVHDAQARDSRNQAFTGRNTAVIQASPALDGLKQWTMPFSPSDKIFYALKEQGFLVAADSASVNRLTQETAKEHAGEIKVESYVLNSKKLREIAGLTIQPTFAERAQAGKNGGAPIRGA